jgi:hypothetical protein
MTCRSNYFPTLNLALESEGLISAWQCTWPPISYGETRQFHWDDGTRWGHWVSIYRDENGRYERPIHYSRG